MVAIQCPVCKGAFEIEMDISIRTKGMTVFRGQMGFVGKLADVKAVMDFVQQTFEQ